MSSRINFLKPLAVLVVLLLGVVTVAQASTPIVIGLNLSLSGAREAAGMSTKMGAELLKEEIHTYDEDVLSRAASLIESYQSQVGWLFGEEPVSSVWGRCARADRGFWERKWKIAPKK